MDLPWPELYTKLKLSLGKLLRRSEDAEDIAQEVFAQFLEAGSKGEIHFPQSYLHRTARNLAINALSRKSHLLEDYLEEFPDPEGLSESRVLEDDIHAQQRFELFCQATAALPDQCRRVLILRKVYGHSQQEVADLLDISVSTVEKHVAKGLQRCLAYMRASESSTVPANKNKATGSRGERY